MRTLWLVLLIAIGGCRPPKPPGESLGVYRVHGLLEETTCAEAVPAQPELDFVVELRADERRGWWKLAGGASIEGEASAVGPFRFEQRQEVPALAPDPQAGYPGCSLWQREIVEGSLAADETLSAESSVEVSPVAGTDCAPLLSILGGPFPVLPCSLRYTLEGQLED